MITIQTPESFAEVLEPEAITKPLQAVLEKLYNWGEQLLLMSPNLLVAFLVLLLFWVCSRIIGASLRRVYHRVTDNPALAHMLETVTRFAVLATGLVVALGVLELDKTVTSLLAGAGVLGLALGFALQNIAANFVSGTLLSIRKPFIVGDVIESNSYFGTVVEVNLRTTNLRTPQGQMVLIPNKEIFEQPIINYTQVGKADAHRRRVDLSVGISYGEDLEHVERVALAAVGGVAARLEEREAELFFQAFGDSSINFVVRFWIEFQRPIHYNAAVSQAIMALKAAFDREGILIPFPIRTLDFGIKGGERLAQVLESRSLGEK